MAGKIPWGIYLTGDPPWDGFLGTISPANNAPVLDNRCPSPEAYRESMKHDCEHAIVPLDPAQKFGLPFSAILDGLKAGFKRYALGEWAWGQWIQGRGGYICDQTGASWLPCAYELFTDKWGEVEVHPSDEYVENRGKDVAAPSLPPNATQPWAAGKQEARTDGANEPDEIHGPAATSNAMPGPKAKLLRIGRIEDTGSVLELTGWEFEGCKPGTTFWDRGGRGTLCGWPIEKLRQIAEAHQRSLANGDKVASAMMKGLRERNAELEERARVLCKDFVDTAHDHENRLRDLEQWRNWRDPEYKTGEGKWHHNRKHLLQVIADAKAFLSEARGHFADDKIAEKAAELYLELSAVDTQ